MNDTMANLSPKPILGSLYLRDFDHDITFTNTDLYCIHDRYRIIFNLDPK